MSDPLDRVIIIGPSCSGKSTLGRDLAARLGAAHVELDALFWEPNWQEPGAETFRQRVRDATAAGNGRWVVSGGYVSRLLDVIWPDATTIIWLDLPKRVTLPRIITRSWRRWRTHELLWGTNYEVFWPQLKLWSEDSLIGYTLRTQPKRSRELVALAASERFPGLRWVRLHSSADTDRWLASVARAEPAMSAT